jgi:DNA polymerase-1
VSVPVPRVNVVSPAKTAPETKADADSAGEKPTLMLLDGNSLAFRAFYALPAENFKTQGGLTTNAVYGFTAMLINLIRDEQPSHIAAAFDVSRQTFRLEKYPEYKAGRSATPDEFRGQIDITKEVLGALGITVIAKPGFEADDVIATLAHRYDERGAEVEVVSGDRDLIDLATERVKVHYTGKGMANIVTFTPAEVQAQYGVPAGHYADFAMLRGDPSDGLPGVAGIGAKTAATVVAKFGTIEQIVAVAKSGDKAMGNPVRAKVLAALDYLAVAPAVVRGRADVPVPELHTAIPAAPADPEMLAALGERFGIASAMERLTAALAKVAG